MFKKNLLNKKIFVGLSGGVDSSVTAALLQRDGYEVVGAFMKNWSDSKDPKTGICAWKEERRDAMAVADHLGIPFLTFDFEDAYREAVVDYLYREYGAGRTPNPDVLCNKYIKFDLFLSHALEEGADAIATGHYARVRGTGATYELLAGVDTNKDQSYFLHQLMQGQLAKTLFPIGHLTKPEVRALAREFALPTAEKKDSQGICFIGKVDMKSFLKNHIPAQTGTIVDVDGHIIGHHEGVAPYTIGQRHGFGGGGSTIYYVVAKDIATQTLVVAPGDNHPALFKKDFFVSDMHWISDRAPDMPLATSVRIRYRQPLQHAVVSRDTSTDTDTDTDARYHVSCSDPQRAVTPGQFAVFYDGEVCLGGGVIA